MDTKKTVYFKKIYKNYTACGKWNQGEGINYDDTDKKYTIEFIDEKEYEIIKENVTKYYENIEKEKRIIVLKEKIYIRQQINEDKTEFEIELTELIK